MTQNAIVAAAILSVAGVISAASGARLTAQAAVTPEAPTFNKEVAPILYKNCTNCHRPGEIAPMSLLTYKDARPWAKSIGNQVARGVMPPWHADPAHGEFLNDRRLSASEKETIARWVSSGAPEGDPSDAPAPPAYSSEWLLGQPDAVFTMQEDYPVPAAGTVAYQYFEVPTNLTEDRWVQAIEVRAGNPSVVHHVIVFARAPQAPAGPPSTPSSDARSTPPPRRPAVFQFAEGTTDIPAGQTGGKALPDDQRKPAGPNDRPAPKRMGPTIGGFAPGQSVRVYQEGTAMKLPAGAVLILQMHYTASGSATTDRTRIAVKFANERPQHEVKFAALINGGLHIPAGAADYRVDADMTVGQDVTIWSLLPHTHVRGKRWSYEATYPDGRTETILAIPKYDFNWQTDYVFKQPLKLPKGTKVHAAAWYDNSANNPSNPDPGKDVWWGDQTWEEMMFTGITYSVDAAPATPTVQGQKP
jgi:hypothetical protein